MRFPVRNPPRERLRHGSHLATENGSDRAKGILSLAAGGFAIGTTEFASMSLLPQVSTGLGVNEPTAGHMVSTYALGVVVGAPVIAVLGAIEAGYGWTATGYVGVALGVGGLAVWAASCILQPTRRP